MPNRNLFDLARPCKECEADLFRTIEAQQVGFIAYHCKHHRCLTIVTIEDGAIIQWTHQGPLSLAEATESYQVALEDAFGDDAAPRMH